MASTCTQDEIFNREGGRATNKSNYATVPSHTPLLPILSFWAAITIEFIYYDYYCYY